MPDSQQKIILLGVKDTVAVRDEAADVYEIFADSDCDCYLGNADTLNDCRAVARDRKSVV